ncbi:hypothetical protein DCC79_00890 [bacterium]|nr:hypothetical protein [Chloroflexi bacterium CFX6]RIL12632.1 MAG: hypothetical protein DCC79_00890 [bacterium]
MRRIPHRTSSAGLLAAAVLAGCQAFTPAGNDGAAPAGGGTIDGVPAYMVKGDPAAKVTLVEWSDYQCPFCAQHFAETAPRIDETYVDSGQVKVIFRDLPLVQIHPQATKAAEAARCVGAQGGSAAYWRMHDQLFKTQDEWSGNDAAGEMFKSLAAGLDVEPAIDAAAFAACLDEGQQTEAVEADLAEATRLGLGATPSFQVQGAILQGALPFEEFKTSLDIVVAGGTLPTATVEPTPEMVEITAPTYDIDAAGAPSQGEPDAPVTVIEFSDYQCPFCAKFTSEVYPDYVEEFVATGRVRHVWMDFPLTSIHPNAPAAAAAAHCARDQGGDNAYWAMHDALFAGQAEWSELPDPAEVFARFATDGGLDGAALRACLTAGTHAAKVEASVQQATSIGINGTPTFFVNGYYRAGVPPLEGLRDMIEQLERGEKLTMEVPKDLAATLEPQILGTPPATATPAAVDLGDAPAQGEVEAPVTLVEFSDYQCPFCQRHTTTVYPEIVARYVKTGQVRYVFKDFPLDTIHPEAIQAAEAARCARDQGGDTGFWTMHRALFERQSDWSGNPAAFADVADGAGLDGAAVQACVEAGTHRQAVLDDQAQGAALGVSGTPAFFINGQLLSGAQPLDRFEAAIAAARSQAVETAAP